MALNTRYSVVDYLKSKGQDSSFNSRARLAQRYGIKNYQGTASQNVQLLQYLNTPRKTTPAPSKPVAPVKPVISKYEQDFYNQYTQAIASGSNDVTKLAQYNNIVNKYGLKRGVVNQNSLRDLSIRALRGDKQAADYLKAMNLKGLTGSALWEGFDITNLDKEGNALKWQYMLDNPTSDYTKNYDMRHYEVYNDMIKNNKPMTDWQENWYKDMIAKWGLDDMNDPFVQHQYQLEQDKQKALQAQDVALNQSLGSQDAANFQQMLALQQQMADRGMQDSGIAADAYMRSQMGANQNYQEMYANAAQTKSAIESEYNNAIYDSKIGQQEYAAGLAQAEKENEIELMKMQTEQDKYLTTATGYVYVNGKMLTSGGKPITSLEYKKLSETQRHNIATENNIAIKNSQDYELGKESNAIKREQIAANLQIALANNKLEYAKLDFNYRKLEDNNKIAQDQIKIARNNAQTASVKNQLTGLGKRLDSITAQITAYQKAGKKPPKPLVDEFNAINDQISALVGGSGF